jgi:hypothetical protein
MFRDQFSRLGSSLLRTLGLLAMVLMLSLLATNRAQAQNPVIDWDAIASTAIVTNAHEPPAEAILQTRKAPQLSTFNVTPSATVPRFRRRWRPSTDR